LVESTLRPHRHATTRATRPEANVGPDRRRRLIHAAEFCFAVALRLAPRRFRFGTVLTLTSAVLPLLRRTSAYRVQAEMGFDGPREIALHFMLNALTRNGTRFDPVIDVKGYEEFERAYAVGKGVLVVGPHAALTLLMIRHFYDRGLDPVVVSPDPRMRVGGTTVRARTVQPSPTFLVKTRSRLRGGDVVCAMPDRAEHHGARTVEFATAGGCVIFAPALMHLAARCGARVIFTEVHAEGREALAGTICASEVTSSGEAIAEEFMEFVRARVEERFLRRG
jgi:lauroyl/myristoyl acyltransferase